MCWDVIFHQCAGVQCDTEQPKLVAVTSALENVFAVCVYKTCEGDVGLCRWDGAVTACSRYCRSAMGASLLRLLNEPGKMRWIIPWATSRDFPEIQLGFVLEGTPSGNYVQSAMLGWLMEVMKFEFLMQFSAFDGFKIAHGPNCSRFCLWTSQLLLLTCLWFDLFSAQGVHLFSPHTSPPLSIFWCLPESQQFFLLPWCLPCHRGAVKQPVSNSLGPTLGSPVKGNLVALFIE